MEARLRLFSYFRSSAAYRVRIVLETKGLPWDIMPVHMLRDGGEQHKPEYRAVNPQRLVPALELDDGQVFVQSIAICEYLEERYPEPAMMPQDIEDRAYVRAVMGTVACEIHPLNNLRVLQHLTGPLALSEESKTSWYRHWIKEGFDALEGLLAQQGRTGRFCLRDAPTLADAFLIPQVYNAVRLECPLDSYPLIQGINERCMALPAFQAASPEQQADAPAKVA